MSDSISEQENEIRRLNQENLKILENVDGAKVIEATLISQLLERNIRFVEELLESLNAHITLLPEKEMTENKKESLKDLQLSYINVIESFIESQANMNAVIDSEINANGGLTIKSNKSKLII